MTPERKEKMNRLLNLRQNDLTVVLENVFDPHNISAVMRTCDAVGIMEIYVINSKTPTRKKWGDRSSASANKWMMVHQFEDTQSCFTILKEKYKQIYCTHLSQEAKDLYELDMTAATALVFGNEHTGVSDEALQYCTGNFCVPQVGIIQSLNISVACAVSIYEAYRQKNIAGHYKQRKLNQKEILSLMQCWEVNEGSEFNGTPKI